MFWETDRNQEGKERTGRKQRVSRLQSFCYTVIWESGIAYIQNTAQQNWKHGVRGHHFIFVDFFSYMIPFCVYIESPFFVIGPLLILFFCFGGSTQASLCAWRLPTAVLRASYSAGPWISDSCMQSMSSAHGSPLHKPTRFQFWKGPAGPLLLTDLARYRMIAVICEI